MAAVNAPTTIIGTDEEVAKFLEPREPRDEDIAVPTSIAFREDKRFIMYGDTQEYTEYATAQEMIQAQVPRVPRDPRFNEVNTLDEQRLIREMPKMEDPVFKPGDVLPTMEDAGFPIEKMQEYDEEFKKMYDDMFSKTSEMGVMGAGDFETRLKALQNELSESKIENPNGGSIDLVSSGEPSVHAPQHPTTPLYYDDPDTSARIVIPVVEEGSYASDTKVDDE